MQVSLALFASALVVSIFSLSVPVAAQAQTKSVSGEPLPRFVSLKASHVNMRVGPGRDYKVEWLYVRKGLPMEVIQEFGNWRKVRDPEGNEGWVLHSLLSGKRVIIITPWDIPPNKEAAGSQPAQRPTIELFSKTTKNSSVLARIEAGALAKVDNCRDEWCRVSVKNSGKSKISGYVSQTQLWGVYPDEIVKN